MKAIQSIAAVGAGLLYLVQGHDRYDRAAFYYVLVDRIKEELFLREVSNGATDLRRFGKILVSGFGTEPSEDAKAYLKKEFNLDTL